MQLDTIVSADKAAASSMHRHGFGSVLYPHAWNMGKCAAVQPCCVGVCAKHAACPRALHATLHLRSFHQRAQPCLALACSFAGRPTGICVCSHRAEQPPPAQSEFEGWQDAPLLLRPRALPQQIVYGLDQGRIAVNTGR